MNLPIPDAAVAGQVSREGICVDISFSSFFMLPFRRMSCLIAGRKNLVYSWRWCCLRGPVSKNSTESNCLYPREYIPLEVVFRVEILLFPFFATGCVLILPPSGLFSAESPCGPQCRSFSLPVPRRCCRCSLLCYYFFNFKVTNRL